MPINILYEDEWIVVCVKPAGVASQTKRLGEPDMESLLKNYRALKGEEPHIAVIHRLDQPVAGIMVFAKTKEAASGLGRQIAGKLFDKRYYAKVMGVPGKKRGVLEDYLVRDGKTNTSRVTEKGVEGAKAARLSYEVLGAAGGYALLKIVLDTGRHHQIRVQLAHAGFPIVGDKKYNFSENMKRGEKELCLCSYYLSFRHPVTRGKMEFEIDNPFHLA